MSTTEKESATYQKMLNEVDDIVRALGAPDLDLDAMVGKVNRGYDLIKMMRQRLEQTKMTVENLRQKFEEPTGA